jgi:hypothetical protein
MAGGLCAAPWETLPPDHWAVPEIKWLQVEGWLAELDPSDHPYTRGEIAAALQAEPRPQEGVALQRFRKLEREFAAEINPDRKIVGYAGGRLVAGLDAHYAARRRSAGYGVLNFSAGNDRHGMYSSLRGDRDLAEDPRYSGKKWSDWSGFAEAAYLTFTGRRWQVKLGRDHIRWGPGDDHLLLNDAPRGLDQIRFVWKWKWGRFQGLAGQISSFTDSTGARRDRFLAAHRLEIIPWRWLRVGASEILIWKGGVRLDFMNPFLPYYAELVNNRSDGNGLLGFDVCASPHPGWQLYTELLLDDIQLEKKTPRDLEPTEWGWLIGVRWAGFHGRLGLDAEYQGVTNRTYNSPDESLRYLNFGLPLGSRIGNDADLLNLQLSYWATADLRLDGFWRHHRQGEGRVEAPFDSSYLDYTLEEGYDEPFPTGTVESGNTLGFGFSFFADARLQAQSWIAYAWVNNADNIENRKEEGWLGRLTVTLRLERAIRF